MDEEQEDRYLFRKILVAIDTSTHSRAALEAAASLAKTMDANIHGLFVHDEMWNRVSSLPSITTVNTFTGQVTSFEDDMMENRVRLLKNRLRRHLERISRKHELTHHWRSEKGNVEEKILEAAEDADLITIGLKGSSAPRKVLGSSAREIISHSNIPVLLLKEGLQLGSTITAVYDGSDASRRGIDIAMKLAEKNESTLTVLVFHNNSGKQEKQNRQLKEILTDSPVFAEIQFMERPNASRFLNTINQLRSGLLIVPKDQPFLKRSLQVILTNINCPLLMMNS